jgi:flagellar motor switch protein FliM
MAVGHSGEATGATAAATEQRGPDGATGARALDFSQPRKFTTELRRRIAAGLEPFCEALSATLSGQLGSEVTVELGELSQNTWAAARAGLAADALAVGIQADVPSHAMLLSVELPMVSQALECLLGGKAANAPAERHLSEIDWTLAKGVLGTVVGELSTAWGELGGASLSRGELDLEGDAGVEVGATDPTLSIALTTSIDGCDSSMCLLAPWSAVESIADGHRGGGPHGPRPESAAGLREGLSTAQVLLRAEVGSVQMPIERMLKILPGAPVELGERAHEGVRLYAEEVSVGRGRPGRSGNRKALKLEVTAEQPTRAQTYARLGRAELQRARAHALQSADREHPSAILESIFVRVWAELGRTHMTLGGALELAPGAVVELDQGAEQPIELFANGLCFASGSLVVTPDGGWGVEVERLL